MQERAQGDLAEHQGWEKGEQATAPAQEDCKGQVSALGSQEEARADLGLWQDAEAFQEKCQEFGES